MTLLPLLLVPAARFLFVGGGPNRRYNQVAIESNVRYAARVLPKGSPLRVLFADGSTTTATVRYTPEGRSPGRGDRYRPADLPRLDGPAELEGVNREVAALAALPGNNPAVLYFTGHGSLAPDLRPDTSQFDLWRRNRLLVPELAKGVAAFRKDVPVVVLMVQCHAGGFAKLIFKNGDPSQPAVENRLCGFFASVEPRPAAGCTPAIDEADYRDFTGYFLAALTGEDRLGKPSNGADADKNGKVGMNEAFCWSLVQDDSIDTPTCTSDEYLRAVVDTPDKTVFATPYSKVLAWASPAQKAALEGLSAALKLGGEDRLAPAYEKYIALDDEEGDLGRVRGYRFIRLAKSVVLGHTLTSGPDNAVRRRYERLLKDEAANPFRP